MSVVVARDPSTADKLIFPWPSPVPWGAEIVCTEDEVAILCPNWEVGETLGPGRHMVKAGSPQGTHVLAYFITTQEKVVPFERFISLIDRSTGQPMPVRFFGTVRIRVGDPELMCHQLVGLPYHDLTTGVLRSVDVSVSRNFERMMAKLCLAMATVSDLATPGAVAQLVSLVTGTHPLATAVTGLEFVRFEQFGLAAGANEPVLWQYAAPSAPASATREPGLDAPTTLDNIALLDPDEVDEDDDYTGQETVPLKRSSGVESGMASAPSGSHPPVHPPGINQTGSNPSIIVREDALGPPPPSVGGTGQNPPVHPSAIAGQIPFAPPPGRGNTPAGGPPPPVRPATPAGGMPGAGPPPPMPNAGPAPGVPGGPPPPMARNPSIPPGVISGTMPPAPRTASIPPGSMPPGSMPPGSIPPGGLVQPTAPGARVQPTMPGMGPNQPPAPMGGRIQPLGPGNQPMSRGSSPYLGPPMGGPPAPAGPGQRRKTPPLGMPTPNATQSGHSPLPIGSQVLVYWNDGLWHTATIRQFSQGQYQVSIDGSHAVTWVQPNQIRRQ